MKVVEDTEKNKEEVEALLKDGEPDQDTFDQKWKNFYAFCHEKIITAEEKFTTMGQKPDPDHPYFSYMLGLINGGLVAFKDVGKSLQLNVESVCDLLNHINTKDKPQDIKEDDDAESTDGESVSKET